MFAASSTPSKSSLMKVDSSPSAAGTEEEEDKEEEEEAELITLEQWRAKTMRSSRTCEYQNNSNITDEVLVVLYYHQ